MACESGGPACARGARRAGPRGTRGRRTDEYATRAKRAPGGCRARSSPDARARAGRNLRRISRSPLNERSFRPRKVGCARAWPYRRVERPRGVRSNLGSDLGRFARAVRAPLCKVVRDARRSVRRTRVETPFVASVLCTRTLTQRRGAGVVRSRGRFACAVLDAYWSSGRFRDFPRTDRAIET